jgi:inorganic pyrophosphatase
VVECRAIGVLQVEQNRTRDDRSPRIRNDRVMAIPVEARRERDLRDLGAFSERARQELEHFALAATALEGKELHILGWGDAATALELVRMSATK